MSVELPPPPTPQLEHLETVRQQAGGGIVVDFRQHHLHVAAGGILDETTIRRAVGAADNLSDAVRNIGAAAYLAGFPAAQVTYALSGTDLYVMVSPGKVSGVRANPAFGPYVRGLASADPLKARDLERHRTLASMYADRAGIDVYPVFEPDGHGGQILDFEKNSLPHAPTSIRAEFGNPGNRFASRYFLDLDLKTASVWGDEFRVFVREGLQNLDAQDPPGDYHEQNLGWSRVTPWGVFGLGGRQVNYHYTDTASNLPILGKLRSGEVLWLYPAYADFNSRWTVQAKADRTDKIGEIDSTASSAAAEYQHEIYTSAELGTSYGRNFQWLDRRWSVEAGVSVRQGLGERGVNNTTLPIHNDLGYRLFRPVVHLKLFWPHDIITGLEVSGQYSGDTVPEQQQWVLGGVGNLTAVLPGVAVGDRGYVSRLYGEVAMPLAAGFELRPRVFAEQGATAFANPAAGQPAGSQQLTDLGVEAGLSLRNRVDASVAYAHEVRAHNIAQTTRDDSRARLYFRISLKL